jgi:hypothetical protein
VPKKPLYPHIPKSQLKVDNENKTITFRGYMLDMVNKVLTIPALSKTYRMRGWSEFYDQNGNDLFIKLNAMAYDWTEDINKIVIKLRDKAYELWGKEIKF